MLDWMEARRVSLGDAELYLRFGDAALPCCCSTAIPKPIWPGTGSCRS